MLWILLGINFYNSYKFFKYSNLIFQLSYEDIKTVNIKKNNISIIKMDGDFVTIQFAKEVSILAAAKKAKEYFESKEDNCDISLYKLDSNKFFSIAIFKKEVLFNTKK